LLGVGLLVLGIVLVVAGAELFFEGLLDVAARLRLSPFVLTAVVSGFELENLVAGIAANAKGLPDAAAGTFFGGTTFLALGVAGLAAVIAPLSTELPRPVLAWTAVSGLPLLAVGVDGTLSRLDGGVLVAWFAVALTAMARSGRSILGDRPPRPRRFAVLRLLAGLGLLTLGGELLGEGIRKVVARFGVSEALFGNTAVAASVEAEEVARVTTPARRGRGDVALGNIFGTIVHFVGFNAGVIALVRPLELGDASRYLHLPVAVAAPVVLSAVVLAGGRLGRLEGAGLLGLYVCYVSGAVVVAL
jgi:cation:H+ antiporter